MQQDTTQLGTVTQNQTNYAYATAGISALSSIANAWVGTETFKAKLKADTEARIANMDSLMTSYEYNQYKLKEQYQALDSAFADKVSQTTLEGMKAIARAKAMSAETGAIGTSTNEAIHQNLVDEVFNVAVINNERKKSLGGILAQRETQAMQTRQELERLAFSSVAVNNNSWVAGLAGLAGTAGVLLQTMPPNLLAETFGMQTNSATSGVDVATKVINE